MKSFIFNNTAWSFQKIVDCFCTLLEMYKNGKMKEEQEELFQEMKTMIDNLYNQSKDFHSSQGYESPNSEEEINQDYCNKAKLTAKYLNLTSFTAGPYN